METPEGLVTLTDIHKLEERYPFKEDELEILIRCYESLKNGENKDDFLMTLALSSPYSHFFLPGNEMRDRVDWIEDHILPAGFANDLRAAISADAFVEYANQGGDKALERFLEGVADTGRRGPKEALRVLYNIVGGKDMKPEDVVDLVFRLAIASDALIVPNLEKQAVQSQIDRIQPVVHSITDTLLAVVNGDPVSLKDFCEWAETRFGHLTAPLSTFVHNLLFHGHAYPEPRIPYFTPMLDHASDIFESSRSPMLTALSFTSPYFGGKVRRKQRCVCVCTA